MNTLPPPPDLPPSPHGNRPLAVSGSLPTSGPALPEITLTSDDERPSVATTQAGSGVTAGEVATWQRGDQTLLVSGSMFRAGVHLPEITLEPMPPNEERSSPEISLEGDSR